MEKDWTEFWVEAQKTSRYYADKLSHYGLTNYELNMYAQLCYLLECYFRGNIQAMEKDLDKGYDDNDDDSDRFVDQGSN